MNAEFNKKRMLDNIGFLLNCRGKKVGELETEAGVSPGYISRTSKDEKAKPGIDFVVKVADVLGVSIDTLLNVDLSAETPTEKYLRDFVAKLKKDTVEDKLVWKRETAEKLNRLQSDCDSYIPHQLFSDETYHEEIAPGHYREMTKSVFLSNAFGGDTRVNGNCFELELEPGTFLYVMNACHSLDAKKTVREIWLHKRFSGAHFLCTSDESSVLSAVVQDLYVTLEEFAKHPKIQSDVKGVIDAFMRNGLIEELDEDLPF